ncbi:UbiX family flavin prenyltransferase [Agrobacterium pusense]|uniref:UbiX family flavin prenyltransferase n=1 Tax=Agrobacterium pusense TaxID=648995 RepID=UPI0007D7A75E|nr:UbiX family flavin prenyltransferase [Agrobacterium pusense]MBP2614315.1 4-hydroxy-3-polyprenylbenzoate decarboxylase [Agrobacterium pusense]MDP9773445.1 4-hydroxy-3-polyprenylbenzoate decarboxylase [Rhizobium sp. SORGH_AS_0755]OAI82885.1 phenolic acid decarboxylase [Rhizobium sp. GHKF11]
MTPCRVVVGVTGASGAGISLRIVERLAGMKSVEIHLVLSQSARRTVLHEEGAQAMGRMLSLASVNHAVDDIGAAIASGSFPTAGMIVAPCSMRTLAAIATGFSDNLLTRAADVHLKERRKLVLMTRETPLHLTHLRNMCTVTEAGAIVMPPVPAFYNRPQSVADIVDQLAARAIDQLGIAPAPQATIWQPPMVKAPLNDQR